ncbi:hypothetical protein [Planctomicrobium sp. SH527]|uniref:hypothetical protein n=1 Tax=Planctomicrobium sp. SH527 TaxID=3448123 RepID=UPI003F5BCBB1
MRIFGAFASCWMLLSVCLCLTGCQEPTLPVASGMIIAKGKVMLDGKALDPGQISFVVHEAKPLPNTAPIDYLAAVNQGEYQVEIPPGKYRVEIRQFGGASKGDSETPGAPAQLLPKKYNEKSEFTAEVAQTGENQFNFELVSDKK